MTTTDFLSLAYLTARRESDDTSTQVGAVLATVTGHLICGANSFPSGVRGTPERRERPAKITFMEHAERNVIFEAANIGIKTVGATLYAPWFSCAECARAIIAAGIIRVVGHKQIFDKTTERWRKSIEDGNTMLDEAGVQREYYNGPIGGVRVLFDGEYWEP